MEDYLSIDSYHQSENSESVHCLQDEENTEPSIPKLIMQTWKNKKVPEKWKESPESINYHMPNWKYVLMTDEDNRNFIKKHFPDFLPYYDDFPYNIQRADAIRACWLYVHGGIYLDLDFVVQKDLSPLFQSDNDLYLVASGNVGSHITNSFMASKPKNSFWLEYIEEMKKEPSSWAWGKHFTVMTTTGPIAINRIARKWEGVIGMLPSKLLMPCSVCSEHCLTEGAYLYPLEGGSWNSWDSKCLNFFLCNWRTVVVFVLILLILLIAIYIALKTRRK